MANQWINHQIDLNTWVTAISQDLISHLQIELLLIAPASLISTDIRSGFPLLAPIERDRVDQLVKIFLKQKTKNQAFTIDWLVQILNQVKEPIQNYYQNHPLIHLEDAWVDVSYNLLTKVKIKH